MVQTNIHCVTMYVKYNCMIMSTVWCYTVDEQGLPAVCSCKGPKDKTPTDKEQELVNLAQLRSKQEEKKRRKIETLRLNPNVLIFLIFADLLSKTKSVQTHCALQGKTRFDDTVQMWISTIIKFKHLLTLILKKSWSSVRAPCCSQSVLDYNPPSPLMLTLSTSLVERLKHEFTLSILQRSSHSSCPDIWIQPSSDFTQHPKLWPPTEISEELTFLFWILSL